MSAAATSSMVKGIPMPMTAPLQGHTPCQIVTIAMQLPNGSIQPRVCLVPYVGPLPAQTQVLTSLQQLQQFQLLAPLATPTLVPSPQPQPAHLLIPTQQKSTSESDKNDSNSSETEKAEEPEKAEEKETSSTSQGASKITTGEEVSTQSPSPSTSQVEECSNASTSLVAETIEEATVVTNVQQEETHVEKHTTDAVPEPIDAPLPKQSNDATPVPQRSSPDITEAKTQPEEPRKVPKINAKDIRNEAEFPSLLVPSSPKLPRRISTDKKSTKSSASSEAIKPEDTYKKAKIYKTVKRIRVRREKTPNAEEVGILEKNTRVQLLYVDGRKGRVIHPINGWVSMKKKKEKQLVQIFNGKPAVTVSNIARSLHREADVLQFLRSKSLRPQRCIWRKNEDFARVEFPSHSEAVKLIRGSYVCDSVKLNAKWDGDYELTVDL